MLAWLGGECMILPVLFSDRNFKLHFVYTVRCWAFGGCCVFGEGGSETEERKKRCADFDLHSYCIAPLTLFLFYY